MFPPESSVAIRGDGFALPDMAGALSMLVRRSRPLARHGWRPAVRVGRDGDWIPLPAGDRPEGLCRTPTHHGPPGSPVLLRGFGGSHRPVPVDHPPGFARLGPKTLAALISPKTLQTLAVDGETLHGSATPTSSAVHLIATLAPDRHLVVQVCLPSDTSEEVRRIQTIPAVHSLPRVDHEVGGAGRK